MHSLPKWALPAAAALVVLFLLIKGRGAGGSSASSPVSTSPNADPLQAAANQLAQQQAQADQQRANALANVGTTGAAEQQILMDCKKLFSDPSYACPGGGRPRVVATNTWPYVGCGCIAPRTGAITFGSLLNTAANLYKTVAGVPGGGGGSGDGYNPSYSSGDVPAGPTSTPYGPGLNEGWGVLPGGSSNNPGEIA